MNNFKDFVNDFKSNGMGRDRSVIDTLSSIKIGIFGIKSILSNPPKVDTASVVSDTLKEIEKNQQSEITITKDNDQSIFDDIKNSLNAIETNTSEKLHAANPEADNINTPEEIIADNSKVTVDLDKKQYQLAKEQLDAIKEIRDAIKPKTPKELRERKGGAVNILALENNTAPGIPSLPERGGRGGAVVAPGNEGKTKPKSRFSKLGIGMGAAGIAGLSYFAYNQFNETSTELLKEQYTAIEQQVESGEITPAEAKQMKQQLVDEHKKEAVEFVSEGGGMLAGATAGGMLGAKMGSFLGPVGAFGGGVAGSIIGSMAGTEAGKKVGEYINSGDAGKVVEEVKEKASTYLEKLKETYEEAKNFIQTDVLGGKENINKIVDNVKDNLSIDNLRQKTSDSLDKLSALIEPERGSPISKMVGDQPGRYVDKTRKEIEQTSEDTSSSNQGDTKAFVNNIINNQSTNNFIPMKATPRADHTSSALDRYTDKLSNF